MPSTSRPTRSLRTHAEAIRFYRRALNACFRRSQAGRLCLQIPQPLPGGIRRVAGTHFHFTPELFLQTGGATEFQFPQERIALAKRHLQNPDLIIKEIAWSCGFANQNYFSRAFKRRTGRTPTEYRRSTRPAASVDAMRLRQAVLSRTVTKPRR